MNQARKSWYSINYYSVKNQASAQIAIYDEIGAWGITAKQFVDELNRIPKGTEITLAINSGGGVVFDAFTIYNNLAARRSNLVARIDGIAASSASFIALAGRRLLMPENAMLMIHEPQGLVIGNADDMRKQADLLDKIRDPIAGIYEKKSGKPREEIEDAMKKETWFSAREAMDFGFADEVTESIEVTAAVDLSKFRNPPQQILNQTKKIIMNSLLEKLVALKFIPRADMPENEIIEQIENLVDIHDKATAKFKDDITALRDANIGLRKKIAERSVSDAIAVGKITNDEPSKSLWLKLFTDAPEEAEKMLATIAAPPAQPQNKAPRAKPSGAGDPLPVKAEDAAGSSDDILDRYNAMEDNKEKDAFLKANANLLLRVQKERQAASR